MRFANDVDANFEQDEQNTLKEKGMKKRRTLTLKH
jgi:hypothetical protein